MALTMFARLRGLGPLTGLTALAIVAACSDDGAQGTPASLSVAGGGSVGADAGAAGSAGQGGASAAGTSSGGAAGTGPVATGGAAGSGPIATGGAAGSPPQGGSGGSGGAGGSEGGDDLPPGGPLFHVSCLPTIGGGDPSKALRFAGKMLVLGGGQRFVYLRALPVGASSLSQAFGPVQLGKTAGPAVDGDPVSFGLVTIPGGANAISGNDLVIEPTQLRLVVNGPESRPCAELDGMIRKPLVIDLSDPQSVDTCLFDPVASDTTPTPAVTDVGRFAPCKP